MSWLQLHIETSDEKAPLIELVLENLGALSVTAVDSQDSPILEPDPGTTPLWSHTTLIALFESGSSLDEITEQLIATGLSRSQIRRENLADRPWEREWLQHFRPMEFGGKLWVVPTSMEAPESAENILRLDPGLAFGTGTHPTTKLCLEWLASHPPISQSVLDYGCGSGILGLAARVLRAATVMATDIDPQALEATQENATLNNLSDVKCLLPDQLPETRYQLVIANILANPLVELAPHLARLTEKDGTIVLSGILAEQLDLIESVYSEFFEPSAATELEGWSLWSGRRK